MAAAIQLRPVIPSDLPVFFEQQRDPLACAMAAFPSRERAAFDAHWAKILADPHNITRTIVADGQVAGNIASFVMEGEREVGFWLGREFWGRGIASAALRLMLEEVSQRPLLAHAAMHNLGSQRVLEKCGFARAGSITDMVDGRPVEMARFQIDK